MHAKKLLAYLLALALLCTLLPVMALPTAAVWTGEGTGTEDDPYRIGTTQELEKYAHIVNGTNGETQNGAACAVLTADLDFANVELVWTPIGKNDLYPFTGCFDGRGYTVSGLTINSDDCFVGLFGWVGVGGIVTNVVLTGADVQAASDDINYVIGAVAGYNSGTVSSCRVEGTVSGKNTGYANGNTIEAGGIVGENHGTVERCRFSGSVTCEFTASDAYTAAFAGGIVGYNLGGGIVKESCSEGTGSIRAVNSGQWDTIEADAGGVAGGNLGTIENCCSVLTGGVCAEASGSNGVGAYAGGIIGSNLASMFSSYSAVPLDKISAAEGSEAGSAGGIAGVNYDTVTDCYYLAAATGEGGALCAEDMAKKTSFQNWKFDGDGAVWLMGPARPLLRWGITGDGTADAPFQIGTAAQLAAFRDLVDAGAAAVCAALTADVDLGGIAGNGTGIEGKKWTPIGVWEPGHYRKFAGVFDGQGFTVSGLYVSGDRLQAGLFGYLGPGGVVENLTVRGIVSSSKGGNSTAGIGGIVGSSEGTVRDCRSECTVTGNYAVGGVVGDNNGAVERCCSTGRVEGFLAGGIVGVNELSEGDLPTVAGCWSTADVYGHGDGCFVGGIVGAFDIGTVENCFSAGSVTGDANDMNLGGVAGRLWFNTTLQYCYSSGSVSVTGSPTGTCLGGVAGIVHGGKVEECYYDTGSTPDRAVYGRTEEGGSVTNCAGLTAAQFAEKSSFSDAENENKNWDFAKAWLMGPARPLLRWGLTGAGTADEPFQIGAAAQLALFRDLVNAGASAVCAELTADVDLRGAAWTPIGTNNDSPFTGCFDGKGCAISGLKINTDRRFVGLFGYIGVGGVVTDTVLTGAEVLGTNEDAYIGGVAGLSRGTVSFCRVDGIVSGACTTNSFECTVSVGGVVGENDDGIVEACRFSGTVACNLERHNDYYDVIPGDAYAGGVVGENGGTLKTSCSEGAGSVRAEVSGNDLTAWAGGVAGLNSGTVENCFSALSGGLSAARSGTRVQALVGGVAGCITSDDNCEVRTSYCAVPPDKRSAETVGGVTGKNEGTVTDCFYLAEATGEGGALSAEDMAKKTSFQNWKFDGDGAVWFMGPARPLLRVFYIPVTVTAENKSKTYGKGDPTFTAKVEGLIGTDTVSYTITRAAGTDAGEYEITPAGAEVQGDYAVTYVPGKLTILQAERAAPAAPTKASASLGSVTLASVEGCEYRLGDGAWQDSPVFSNLAQDTQYSFTQRYKESKNYLASPESGAALLSTNAHVHDWTYSVGADTNVIAAVCGNADGGHDGDLHASLTISAPAHTEYGDGRSSAAAVTGGIDGIATPAVVYMQGETVLTAPPTNAGDYRAGITLGGVTAWVDYTVARKEIAAEVTVTGGPFVYTGQQITPAVTVKDGQTVIPASEFTLIWEHNVSVGEAIVRLDDVPGGNYSYDLNSYATFRIDPKPVTVTADNKTKTAGEDDPVFTAKVEGLIGTDAVSYSFTRAPGETAGEYAVTPTGDAVQGNYALTFVPGTLTITAAPEPPAPTYDDWDDSPATYPPTVAATEHGAVKLSPATPKAGDKVAITLTPDTGYQPARVVVTDAQDTRVPVRCEGERAFVFTQPAGRVRIKAVFAPVPEPLTALPPVVRSPQRITVNGAEINVEAYNIDGTNFFRLRDLAAMLRGTPAQFNVRYDEARNAVVITTGEPYDGTLTEDFTDKSASAVFSPQTIEIDGRAVSLTAFNIGGNNFFGLRELAPFLGYGVDYDEATNTAQITSK